MAEVHPFRRSPKARWTRADDYGVPPRAPRKGGRKGGGGWWRAARETGPILWALPLAAFVGVFTIGLPDTPGENAAAALPVASAGDVQSARFGTCGGFFGGDNCVIDGDTFRYRGEKIRIADINTPETGKPQCAYEAELGARATGRLKELLNAGPFTLQPIDRSHNQYGRALYVVTRGGQSIGTTLVNEGLAERWQGFRRDWC